MVLVQTEQAVKGHYVFNENRCVLRGAIEDAKLLFVYTEPAAEGEGWFALSPDGKSFRGLWRAKGQRDWSSWSGVRTPLVLEKQSVQGPSFAGLWQTQFGRLRLVERAGEIRGVYAYGSGGELSGKQEGRKLSFSYREAAVQGSGAFTLSADGRSFDGNWSTHDKSQSGAWQGTRIGGGSDRQWLVVLEARWETSLVEREYAFGTMLTSFFARSPHVEVRHRFFDDAQTLRKLCVEAALLAEPTIVTIAAHGTRDGLLVDNQRIGLEPLIDGLACASNVKLLHFSSCEVLGGELAAALKKRIVDPYLLPVSGYDRTVDWSASAIAEFLYFDLILTRSLAPLAAADELKRLLPLAGSRQRLDAAFEPLGFQILAPE